MAAELITRPAYLDPVVHIDKAVPYKATDGRAVRADIYTPSVISETPHPAVIFLHGGLWITGKRSQHSEFARGLARSGYVAMNIDFSRSPAAGFGAQVDDIKESIRWLRENADAYNVDPDRIGIFGSSSGGHLAALAAFAGDGEGLGDDPPGLSSEVQAAFLLYGIYRMGEPLSGPDGRREIVIGPIERIVAAFAGVSDPDDPEGLRHWSPEHYINGNEPPTIMVHGEDDNMSPVVIAQEIADSLNTASGSGSGEVFAWPRQSHGFGKLKLQTRPFIFLLMLDFFEKNL
jgi:acetyl esterase/lipase